ncbi:MAG TPA: hypothetical protein VN033_03350 [Vulgatibacter sp.]|nr:hypothetical protein [Vulgatibacter sp.]
MKIRSVESALWPFVTPEGIELTNDLPERDLRRAVLWRNGTNSETGSRYAERILTTTKTLRQQNRHVVEFLTQSLVYGYRSGCSRVSEVGIGLSAGASARCSCPPSRMP